MNNYWTRNRLPELRNVTEAYLQALPAGELKLRVIEASGIYEREREGYLGAYRASIGFVNTLVEFGSLTNEANLRIREPFAPVTPPP